MNKLSVVTCRACGISLFLVFIGSCQNQTREKWSTFTCTNLIDGVTIEDKGIPVQIEFTENSEGLAVESLRALNVSIMIGVDESEDGRFLSLVGYFNGEVAESRISGGSKSTPARNRFVLQGWKLHTPFREFTKRDGEIDRNLKIRTALVASDFSAAIHLKSVEYNQAEKFYWSGKLKNGKGVRQND